MTPLRQEVPRRRSLRSLLAAGLRLSGALLQVLSTLVVAKFAPPDQAGHYVIGFALSTIVAVLGRAGFDQALTRFVASDLALQRADLAWITCLSLLRRFTRRMLVVCPFLAAATALASLTPWASPEQVGLLHAMLPFVVAAPFLGIASLSGMALQASGRSLASVASMFYVQNVAVIAGAALPITWIGHGAFVYAYLGGCLLAAAVGTRSLARRFRDVAPKVANAEWEASRRADLGALIRDNTWSVVGNLALTWGPTSLLGALSTPLEAARFGVANRAAQLVSFAVPALNFVLAPRFAALAATQRHAEMRRTLSGSLVLALALCTAVAAPMVVAASPIMRFFGSAYASGTGVLVLLVLAQWATGAAGAALQFLLMTGGEKTLRQLFVGTLLVALPAGVPLVAMHGAEGAAMMSLGACLGLNLCATIAAWLRARARSAPSEAALGRAPLGAP